MTAPVIPTTPEALEEALNDPKFRAEHLASPAALKSLVTGYAAATQGPDSDLFRTIKAETQRAMVEYLKEKEQPLNDDIRRLNLDPQSGVRPGARQGGAYNPKALGAVLDAKFKDTTDFLRMAWHLNGSQEAMQQRLDVRQLLNAAGSVVPSDGGFLVPETLRANLLQIALETAVVRSRATVIPMESARVPFPTIDVTTNAGSLFGGMIAYWGEESAALVDSSPKFGRIELDAKKLTGLTAVPNELLQDSFTSFVALLGSLWPQVLAFYEDIAFLTGSGTGEPLGLIGANNPASVAITKEVGQAATTIVLENIIKMYSRMLPASLSRAVWLVSPETLPELFTMALSVGTGGAPVMLANVTGAAPMTMFGRPIVVTEKASRLGTRGDVVFADLSYYLIGDRQAMSLDSSTDYRFGNDQTTFRTIQRVDGRPWIRSPITPQNSGATLTPFVEIETR